MGGAERVKAAACCRLPRRDAAKGLVLTRGVEAGDCRGKEDWRVQRSVNGGSSDDNADEARLASRMIGRVNISGRRGVRGAEGIDVRGLEDAAQAVGVRTAGPLVADSTVVDRDLGETQTSGS